MPERDDTYKEVTDYLQQWLEGKPNCPGYPQGQRGKRKRARQSDKVLYAQTQEGHNARRQKKAQQLCRNYQRSGQCKHGDNCHFRHEKQPYQRDSGASERARGARKCFNCGSEHHLIANCPKNKRDSPRRSPRIASSKDKAKLQRAFAAFVDNFEREELEETPRKKRKSTHKKTRTKKKTTDKSAWVFATAYVHERVYKAAESGGADMKHKTVIDGGSTCSITTDFNDCIDIEECQETIMVGGKKGNNKLKCK